MYTVLAVAWMIPIARRLKNHKSEIINLKSEFTPYIYVCALVSLYGGLMELLQHYCTLTRSGEWIDLLADFIGALIGVVLVFVIKKHYCPFKF